VVTTVTETPAVDFSLLDYVAIGRRRWPWLLAPIVVLLGLGYWYTAAQPARYQATARVLLADTAAQKTLGSSTQSAGVLVREMSNEIALANSDAVEGRVEEELGELPVIRVTSENQADVLVFTATAGDATMAARHANVWAEQYVAVKRDEAVASIDSTAASLQIQLEELRTQRQELRAPLADYQRRITEATDPLVIDRLQREHDELAADLSYELTLVTSQAESTVADLADLELQAKLAAAGEARVIQVAAPPLERSNAPLSRNLGLAAVLGLVGGGALALMAETRDSTVKTAADVQAATDLPVLAAVPEAPKQERDELGWATLRSPESGYANGYHRLRSSIEFASLDNNIRSIMVTSANSAEGKSTTSANLALALGSVGKRTVLIDSDFHRPTIHQIFGYEMMPGLSDIIVNEVPVTEAAHSLAPVGLDEVRVVPIGTPPPSPASFVATSGFVRGLTWFAGEADVVVIDSAPVLAVADSLTLAKHVDAVVMTVRAGRTTAGEIDETVKALRQVGANILGIILIGVDRSETYGRGAEYRASSATRSRSNGSKQATSLFSS
jgi:polysaccharide biosynthesis transport protein